MSQGSYHPRAGEQVRDTQLVELHEETAEELGLLLNRALTYDECSAGWVRQQIFGDPAAQPRYTLGLREDGRLVSAAVGVVQERRQEGPVLRVAHLKVVATDPRARRQGYAARLLDELEARFSAEGLTEITTRGPRHYFWAGVDVRYSAALCLFQRRGYSTGDDTFNLGVDLDGRDFSTAHEEDALAAAGIAIRRAEHGDRAVLDAYMRERWSETWHREAMESFNHDPISCHIALQDGRIVGFAATDIARPGWFGPTGTNEELRGKGIGSILLRRCLADWQRDGRKFGEISWIGPLYFYVSSCDARVSRVLRQMSKRLVR
jgi:ribosomal protein S18 acetylase RimI-like enzyme